MSWQGAVPGESLQCAIASCLIPTSFPEGAERAFSLYLRIGTCFKPEETPREKPGLVSSRGAVRRGGLRCQRAALLLFRGYTWPPWTNAAPGYHVEGQEGLKPRGTDAKLERRIAHASEEVTSSQAHQPENCVTPVYEAPRQVTSALDEQERVFPPAPGS